MQKPFPIHDPLASYLVSLPYEAIKWEIFKTALELHLYDQTTTPTTAKEVAAALSLHHDNTLHLLNALVALGTLTKEGEQYRNSPLTEALFTSGEERSLGPSLLFMASWGAPLLNGGLKKILQEGPPPIQDLGDPTIWEQSARLSLPYTRAGRAQELTRHVIALPEFPRFKKILDMGAGPGAIGIGITAAHPSLQCVLMDLPPVAKVAKDVVSKEGMGERVTVVGGDYMRDDLGSGYDLVMANYTLNFFRDQLHEILGRVLKALAPGGLFLVSSDGTCPDGTAPPATVISWFSTKVMGQDMSIPAGEIARIMLEVGFVSTERRTLTDLDFEANGPAELTIGRKALHS